MLPPYQRGCSLPSVERFVRVAMVVAVVSAAVLPWNARPAAACSCVSGSLDADNLSYADTVFSGTVREVEEWDQRNSSAVPIDVVLSADRVWRGEVTSPTTVRTSPSGASCGYTFQIGTRYLVYARGDAVSYCSPTQPFSEAAVRALESVTGPGREVTQEFGAGAVGDAAGANVDGATTTAELAVALAVTAILSGATVALSRRR